MTFALLAYRFMFRAVDRVHFPAGKSGNIFRGAFGEMLRRIACEPECSGARSCHRRDDCEYARLFEPALGPGAPGGFADPPRPFVFRTALIDGCMFSAGEPFPVDIHLFDLKRSFLASLVLTFRALADQGLGPGRGRIELVRVSVLGASGQPECMVFDGSAILANVAPIPIELKLEPDNEAPSRIVVRFLTPTELKSGNQVVHDPGFSVLFARVRDRISSLVAFYGSGPLKVNFRNLSEQAGCVQMLRSQVQRQHFERRSSRTGRTHPLGGFIGEAEYEGDLREIMPFLRAAEWTGVGRHTVWGKGAIRVSAVSHQN